MTSDDRIAPSTATWPRPAMLALAALSATLLGTALIITYHNLRYSYARVLDILGGGAGVPGDTALTVVAVPDWVAPFLQDLSVVSPALVVFTAGRMLVAALLLFANPVATRRWANTHFPFPEPYKVYFIQMGLLGTIIGFVLAFAEVDPRAERQSLILLEALGTALWSTLTAIVLAYVFCPVVEGVYRGARTAVMPPEPKDTRSALDLLRHRTHAAADELDVLAAATRTLAEASQALSGELGDRRLDARVTQLESHFAELMQRTAALAEVQRELRSQFATFEVQSERLAARSAEHRETLARHDVEIASAASGIAGLRQVSDALEGEGRRSRAAIARLDAIEEWLRRPPSRRDAESSE